MLLDEPEWANVCFLVVPERLMAEPEAARLLDGGVAAFADPGVAAWAAAKLDGIPPWGKPRLIAENVAMCGFQKAWGLPCNFYRLQPWV